MIEELHLIKEQLFDAPVEVKGSFNKLVDYFDRKNQILTIQLKSKDQVYELLNSIYFKYRNLKGEELYYKKNFEEVWDSILKSVSGNGIKLDPDYNKPLSKVHLND